MPDRSGGRAGSWSFPRGNLDLFFRPTQIGKLPGGDGGEEKDPRRPLLVPFQAVYVRGLHERGDAVQTPHRLFLRRFLPRPPAGDVRGRSKRCRARGSLRRGERRKYSTLSGSQPGGDPPHLRRRRHWCTACPRTGHGPDAGHGPAHVLQDKPERTPDDPPAGWSASGPSSRTLSSGGSVWPRARDDHRGKHAGGGSLPGLMGQRGVHQGPRPRQSGRAGTPAVPGHGERDGQRVHRRDSAPWAGSCPGACPEERRRPGSTHPNPLLLRRQEGKAVPQRFARNSRFILVKFFLVVSTVDFNGGRIDPHGFFHGRLPAVQPWIMYRYSQRWGQIAAD